MSTVWDEKFEDDDPEISPEQFAGEEEVEWSTPEQPQELVPEEKEESFGKRAESDLAGLLYLGRLEEDLDVFGHEIKIKTLTIGEELQVYQLTQVFEQNSDLARGRAYATAVVAAAIQEVDGKPLTQSLGPKDDKNVIWRKYKIIQEWYWPTIEPIYYAYTDLERRQNEALEKLLSKSPGSLTTNSSPSSDS